jgi:drug/metabolite transporter (DMT)-like permease
MTPNLRGILAMCIAMALFIVNDTLVKLAAAELPTHQILFLRGLMATLLLCGALAVTGIGREWRRALHPLVGIRSLLEAAVAYLYIAALATLAVADATAILLLSPLLITAYGAIVMKEDVRWRRWAAIAVGCLGMLLVLRPGGSAFGIGAVLAVLSTVGVAARDLVTRRLPSDIPTLLVTASTVLVLTLMSGAASLLLPNAPVRPTAFVWLAVAAALVLAGNFAIILAFRGVDVSAVSPFRYTTIVWAVAASWLVFGEIPTPVGWLGIALIVGGGLYAMHRETVAARRSSVRGP